MATSSSFSPIRRVLVIAGIALAAQAIAFFFLLAQAPAAQPSAELPVTFEQYVLGQVDVRLGALTPLILLAASFLLLASRAVFPAYARRLEANHHGARWLIFSLTSSITVFLVAQLNDITAIGSLVLIYASTSTMTLFSVLQERVTVTSGPRMLPLAFGAAIGIVPWGIIAFQTITAGIVGTGPDLAVRLVTVVMLAAACVTAYAHWTEQRRAAGGVIDSRGERAIVVTLTVGTSVFAWAVLAMTF
jgi:hypothetical protein